MSPRDLDAHNLDTDVASKVFGLTDGVDFGFWGEHNAIHRGGWYCSHCTAYMVWCGRCGQEWCPDCHDVRDDREPPPQCRKEPPAYSTDIAAAFQVVEHMRRRGYLYGLGDDDDNPGRADHYACFYVDGIGPVSAVAPTPAEAICRAALAVAAPQEGRETHE